MADKKSSSGQSKVTRIRARGDKATTAKKPQSPKPQTSPSKKRRNPLGGILGYFKGAWSELKQVHWPNRRTTWGMTGALLLYTAFFVALILLIDIFFEYLFKLILR